MKTAAVNYNLILIMGAARIFLRLMLAYKQLDLEMLTVIIIARYFCQVVVCL